MVMVWELLEDNLKKKIGWGQILIKDKANIFQNDWRYSLFYQMPFMQSPGVCRCCLLTPHCLSYKWHLESKGVAVTGDGFVPVKLPSIPKLPDSAGHRLDAFKWSNVNISPKGTWNSSILHRLVQNSKILWFKYTWFCNFVNKIFF